MSAEYEGEAGSEERRLCCGAYLTVLQTRFFRGLERKMASDAETIKFLLEELEGPVKFADNLSHFAGRFAARPADEQFREFYRLVVILLSETKARIRPGDDETLAVIYNHVHEVLKVSGPIMFNSQAEEQ
jgi:hypothetical protein